MLAAVEDTLRNYRLLEAMRAGDTNALALALQSTTQQQSQQQPAATQSLAAIGLPMSGSGGNLPSAQSQLKAYNTNNVSSPVASNSTTSINPNSPTPLHLAAAFASLQVLQFLLKPPYKFNINGADTHGNTVFL